MHVNIYAHLKIYEYKCLLFQGVIYNNRPVCICCCFMRHFVGQTLGISLMGKCRPVNYFFSDSEYLTAA